MTVNTAAKLLETVLQLLCSGQHAYKSTQRYFWHKSENLFNAHFSVAILFVVDWPNHGPGIAVE
jgi:hypothetical protein